MKKTGFVLTLFLLITTVVWGQKMTIGGELGFASSGDNTALGLDFEDRIKNYFGGLNFKYRHNDRLSFSTGLHYLSQGYKYSTGRTTARGAVDQYVGSLDYLTVPVAVDLHFLKSRKLIVTAGLYVGYNVKAVQDYTEFVGGGGAQNTLDISSYIHDFSLGGIIGLGYQVIDNDKIEVISNLKYYQGLTDSHIHNNGEPAIRYNSAVMTLMVNYKLYRNRRFSTS